jgi:GTP cyclohydrolase II
VGKPDFSAPVPIRIHSSCITGDLCSSLKCDCGDHLRNGLSAMKEAGGGVLLYLDQEGRGTGIGAKMRAYGYQHLGLDTIDADAELGYDSDHRRYEAAIAMLELLGIRKVILFTNNPTKIAALSAGSVEVHSRVPVRGEVNPANAGYLKTKKTRAGHMLEEHGFLAAG